MHEEINECRSIYGADFVQVYADGEVIAMFDTDDLAEYDEVKVELHEYIEDDE